MYKYRSNKNNKGYKIIFFGIYFIFFSVIFLFNDMGYLEYKKIEKENEKIELEIKTKIEMLDVLEVEKKRLEKDFMYIEKIAREEFKMAKKDEKVFTIIKNKPKKENN